MTANNNRPIHNLVKDCLGFAVSNINGQCEFSKSIFVIAHMRCGSTALSNVLTNHPSISGFGEAHIEYGSRSKLGNLVIRQIKEKAGNINPTIYLIKYCTRLTTKMFVKTFIIQKRFFWQESLKLPYCPFAICLNELIPKIFVQTNWLRITI